MSSSGKGQSLVKSADELEQAWHYGLSLIHIYVSFSEQKPSTDTVAADMENKPFRDKGKL